MNKNQLESFILEHLNPDDVFLQLSGWALSSHAIEVHIKLNTNIHLQGSKINLYKVIDYPKLTNEKKFNSISALSEMKYDEKLPSEEYELVDSIVVTNNNSIIFNSLTSAAYYLISSDKHIKRFIYPDNEEYLIVDYDNNEFNLLVETNNVNGLINIIDNNNNPIEHNIKINLNDEQNNQYYQLKSDKDECALNNIIIGSYNLSIQDNLYYTYDLNSITITEDENKNNFTLKVGVKKEEITFYIKNNNKPIKYLTFNITNNIENKTLFDRTYSTNTRGIFNAHLFPGVYDIKITSEYKYVKLIPKTFIIDKETTYINIKVI